MDGSLQLAWTKGYRGNRVEYITEDTFCFKVGNNIKFVDELGTEHVYLTPGEGIGPLAIHSINKVFAFSENNIRPTIFVLQYPSFQKVIDLTEGTQLEYINITFSSSDYLASISGVPDFQLIIWRYSDGTKLVVQSLPHVTPNWVCFNPGNWRQLAMCTATDLTIWNMEQSNNTFLIKQHTKIKPMPERQTITDRTRHKLPASKTSLDGYTPGSRMDDREVPHRAPKDDLSIPLSSICGLTGEDLKNFTEYQDDLERVVPVTMCWTVTSDLLVGCANSQMLKVIVESNEIVQLLVPLKRPDSAAPGKGSDFDDVDGLSPGSLNCMELHKKGLYAAGTDGIVRLLSIQTDGMIHVLEKFTIGFPITTMSFNSAHHRFVVGSKVGSIHLCDPSSLSTSMELVHVCNSNVLSIGCLASRNNCVTVRETGELQVWEALTGKVLAMIQVALTSKVWTMATSPLTHIAVVGMESGFVKIVDLSNLSNPRIIHSVHLHQGPVRAIHFNETGQVFITGSMDQNVFVVDGRPSGKFEPLGFLTVPGDIKSIDSFYRNGITKVIVTTDTSDNPTTNKTPANKLYTFTLPADLFQNLKSKLASLRCDFLDEAIEKTSYQFNDGPLDVTLLDERTVYGLGCGKSIVRYVLPVEAPKKKKVPTATLR